MNKDLKIIIGWHMDSEYTSVYALDIHTENIFPVSLNAMRMATFEKTAIAYLGTDEIVIGNAAWGRGECLESFIHDTQTWYKKSSMGIEYRQHMSDFIRTAWEHMLCNPDNRATLLSVLGMDEHDKLYWKTDNILLAVNCPFFHSGRSERDQYEILFYYATGVENVVVVDQALAAMYSLENKLDVEAEVNGGILVVCCEPGRVEGTYIRREENMFRLEWGIPVYPIERGMCDYILGSDSFQEKLERCSGKCRTEDLMKCRRLLWQLSTHKEGYFEGELDKMKMQCDVPIINESGDVILDEDGEPEIILFSYHVDEMMEYATEEYKFSSHVGGAVVNEGSWRQTLHVFLGKLKEMAEQRGLPVETIIFTGTYVNRSHDMSIAEAVFSDSRIVYSDTSDSSEIDAAKGLVLYARKKLLERQSVKRDGRRL